MTDIDKARKIAEILNRYYMDMLENPDITDLTPYISPILEIDETPDGKT